VFDAALVEDNWLCQLRLRLSTLSRNAQSDAATGAVQWEGLANWLYQSVTFGNQ
jgi:hypothetical protein